MILKPYATLDTNSIKQATCRWMEFSPPAYFMPNMIEVFKTNVELEEQVESIMASLIHMFSSLKINFDLDDCDKILRVEGHEFSVDRIRETIHALGYSCELLE